MELDKTALLLKNLMETDGISGSEEKITHIMEKELTDYGCDISYDKLGSVIGKKEGDAAGPHVMLAGHADEVGFLVSRITDDGFLKVVPIGGWAPQNLLSQRVTVYAEKGPVVGTFVGKIEDKEKVVKLEDMFIDVGAMEGFDIQKELGIRIGDPVCPKATFEIMGNPKMYLSKAWDNRLGIALAIKAVEELKNQKHPNVVYAVGTVQEEVGLRGARTAAEVVQPDVAFGLDVAGATDVPWGDSKKQAPMGSGALLVTYDRSLLPNRKLLDFTIDLAKAENIPYSLSVCGGGRDTGMIQFYEQGVPCLPIACPTRYGHNHSSMVHRDDFDATVALLVALMKKLDKDTVEGFCKFNR